MDHLSILFKNDNNLKCLIRSIFNPRDTFPSHLSDLGIAIAIIKIPPDQSVHSNGDRYLKRGDVIENDSFNIRTK